MKKKILVISYSFFPENLPINYFCKNLTENEKFEIDVLTCSSRNLKISQRNFFKSKDLKIYRVPFTQKKFNHIFNSINNYLLFIILGIVCGFFLLINKKYSYVLVYGTSPLFQGFIGLFFKFTKKIPLIFWVQDIWPDSILDLGIIKKKFLYKSINFFMKIIYNKTDYILSQSTSLKRHLEKKLNIRSVFYLPNFSFEFNLNKKYKKKFNINFFNIIYAGNIGHSQNFEDLLYIAQELRHEKIFFHVIGDGNRFNWLKNIIKIKNLNNIILHGYFNNNKIYDYYQSCDCLLLLLKNNKSFNKIIPSKLQTYLYFKKPIIGLVSGEAGNIIKSSKAGLVLEDINNKSNQKKFLNFTKLYRYKLDKYGVNAKNYYKNNYEANNILRNFIKIISNDK